MAWRGRAKKGHGADLVKPEVLEMNEEVCGGVRTLQITAKRGLDAEEGGFDDSTLCPSGIYTCCRCEPQPRGCVATASWGAPAMSMPGCIPVWGLLPAPPPSLALSVSLSGPLSCQSAFCGLLRDEESEHYRVTSASGRGCLGYLAAPAALTVRNCLIKQSDKRQAESLRSSGSSMTVRRTEADRTPGGPPIDRPVSVARVPFLASSQPRRVHAKNHPRSSA